MNLRGRIVNIERYPGCRPQVCICTRDQDGQLEVVPTEPGHEDRCYPRLPTRDATLIATVYDSWDDPALIEDVKARCRKRVQEAGKTAPQASHCHRGLQTNLSRLQSLDGDKPAVLDRPTPDLDRSSSLDRVFERLFVGCGVVGVIQDEVLCIPKDREDTIGAHLNYIGKLLFLEIPLDCDDDESGEYIIVNQSPDSLYGVKTTCCQAGLEVVRIPFEAKGRKVTILDVYEDDGFIHEFIERLDGMDYEDYEPIECDLAETAGRQLGRMLEKKLTARARRAVEESLDRVMASGRVFNRLSARTNCQTGSRERCGV